MSDNTKDKQSFKKELNVWRAVSVGWLFVNIPAILIMLGVFMIGIRVFPGRWWVFLLLGMIAGWVWWAYTIPHWRRWALRRGAEPTKLQKAAVATGLTWPKGSLFEKTEAKIDS